MSDNGVKAHSHSELLERFDAPEGDQVTTFKTDELTALCPFDFGGPDFYRLKIQYVAKDHVIESRSLKNYLESWRAVEISAEGLAEAIHNHVESVIEPQNLHVCLEQNRRGGISETVEMGEL